MTARRFYVTGFVADDNEYEIRYPAEQQYAGIDKDSLIAILEDYRAQDKEFIGGIRYRPKDSVEKFTPVDKRDMFTFLDALKGEAEQATEEKRNGIQSGSCFAPIEDDDDGTVFRVCCHPMMKAMLGGEGHVLISLGTGRIQMGNEPMSFCPFCGKPIRTYDPPVEVIPPEE